jgi:hypothetical protein
MELGQIKRRMISRSYITHIYDVWKMYGEKNHTSTVIRIADVRHYYIIFPFPKAKESWTQTVQSFLTFVGISLWSKDRVENEESMRLFSHEIHIKGTILQRKQSRPVWASQHELPPFPVLVWSDKLWSVVFNYFILINNNI